MQHPIRPIRLVLALSCALVLSACVSSLEKVSGWLSSNADIFAVLDGQVMLGKMNFAREREASAQLQTQTGPLLACTGNLTYTATQVGLIQMNCNDGRSGRLNFAATGPITGTARGLVGNAPMSLTYGLSADKAAGHLGVPIETLAAPKQAPASSPPPN
jgi:spore coat protein U-like protein